MYSKPCGYARCRERVVVRQAYLLKRKNYHSIACQVAAKKAAGWTPHAHLNHENRRRGGLASAKRTHALWHRRKLEAAVRECMDLIPKALRLSLRARDLALLKVLFARAFERGRVREHKILRQQRDRHTAKGAAA